jgi:putative intracellular protease/amidase
LSEQSLAGKTIAILVANGFEEVMMTEPQRALLGAGAALKLVSPEQGLVNGWHGQAWGHYFPIDIALSGALAADFDALIVPGGLRSIEKLAASAHAKRFLRGFIDAGKPVAALGEAARLLIAADRAAGRTIAGEQGQAEALETAGARPSDEALAIDRTLLTSRPDAAVDLVKSSVLRMFSEQAGNIAAAA